MLSLIQEQIVKSSAKKIVVIASAASGKSTVVVERIRYLIENGFNPRSIVSLSFTNNAANNVRDRLDNPPGLICNTVHGYANMLLSRAGISTKKTIEREDFDGLFQLVKQHPECIQPVDYLTLDEAQDSTHEQFEFIFDYVKPKQWMIVGDPRQTIYGFNGSDSSLLINLTYNEDVVTYELNENFRNGKTILNYAKEIIRGAGSDYIDSSISMSGREGKLSFIEYDLDLIPQIIKKAHKEYGQNYGDWFILNRTNQQLEETSKKIKTIGIPYDTFRQAQLTNAQIDKKMKEDTVKILTIHSSKGLERKNVIVIGAHKYNFEETCVSYVAATRAEDWLIWTSSKPKAPRRQRWRNY